MCGIIAYIGKNNAIPYVIEGLLKLEYRGYDSAGIAFHNKGSNIIIKDKGRVLNLKEMVGTENESHIAIGHTRWATHGKPSKENAHPHSDCKNNVIVIHNGIIENYSSIKEILIKEGHRFVSETDTEVIAHLIEKYYDDGLLLEQAVKIAVDQLIGTYGLVCISSKEPDKIIAIRKSSPLIIGVGQKENFIASDAPAIIKHTKKIIYLEDDEFAVITADDLKIYNKDNLKIDKKIELITWDEKHAQKDGYQHFMLKEIFEQPQTFNSTLAGHIDMEEGTAHLGGMQNLFPGNSIHSVKRIIILGCGTSYHAGLLGEYYLERFTGIPTEVEIASEFRYRSPIIDGNTFIIAISQSGETADTIAAIKEAKQRGAKIFGIVNVVGSSIAREVDQGLYIHVGPEIGVASTKAFLSEILALFLVALYIGRKKMISLKSGLLLLEEIQKIPEKIGQILKDRKDQIEELAHKYKDFSSFLYLGRNLNYPIALEGALKLKEISYIHAEGYPAGEMKHGPIALIDKNFPTFFIAPNDSIFAKSISNIQEIKSRDGDIILLTDTGTNIENGLVNDIIKIPDTIEELYPFLCLIPVQLFAYYIANIKGRDVDKPRNLAKSVTVE